MTFFRVGAIVVLLGVSACGSPSSTPRKGPSGTLPEDDAIGGKNALVPSYNLGDVDFATVLWVGLSNRSQSPTIFYKEEKTQREVVALANATVPLPPPANLWIAATIDSPVGYRPEDTVLVRMSVTVDSRKEPLVTKSFVFSGTGLVTHPEHVEVDLMPFLDPLPASVLVLARAQIVWFPATDAATIDPETADISKGQSLDRLSNPFRIDFK